MLFASLLLVCLAALAAAGPVERPWEARRLPLSQAGSRKTICPIVVEKDIDENRIPQRIKVIKCKEGGSPATGAGAVRRHQHGHCAAMSEGARLWACAELYDSVLVYYRNSAEVGKLDVAVGCTCLQWTPHPAHNTEDVAPH